MSDDAARLRARAKECRDLAGRGKSELAHRELEIAHELETEAERIDAEQASALLPPMRPLQT